MLNKSMLGKWDKWYKNIDKMGSFRYGDTITYRLAADFMADVAEVEDWGCGTGGFKRFYKGKYIGVDGSTNPFVDKVADLREYKSNVDGIVMRHVLEHNYDWKLVLENAIASFNKKLCIILFTPFATDTKEIAHNKKHGVDVPDIAFCKDEIESFFEGLKWKMESHETKTGYGIEHIYFIEKKMPRIAVISANLGGFDASNEESVPQSMACDYFMFTDENFPPRFNAMTPRLQAKIPKFFGWQLVPGYDYYLWLDGNLALYNSDSLKYFYDNCQDHDIVVLKHPRRPNIRKEVRYVRMGIRQNGKNPGSRYVVARYANELFKEQHDEISADKNFKDDFLISGGAFMYKNTPEVHKMFKEWWYHVSRYIIQDQISFPYVLKKSGIKINIRPDFDNYPCVVFKRHKNNYK